MDENIPLFDKYLGDSFSKEERLIFEKRLKEEPEFNAEFEEYKLLVEGLEVMGDDDTQRSIRNAKSNLKKEGFFLNEEDINDYLLGLLPEDKVQIIEQKIQADTDFAKQVDFEKILLEGIRLADNNQLKKSISEVRNKLEREQFFEMEGKVAQKENIKAPPAKIRSLSFYLSRVAAAIILLAGAFFAYNQLAEPPVNRDQLFANTLEIPSAENIFSSSAVLGGNDEMPAEKEDNYQMWKKAKLGYENKAFENSLSTLEKINLDLLTEPEQEELIFQKALINMLLENYNEAFDLFTKTSYDIARTSWYKALLMLKLNKPKAELMESFKPIANSPTNRYNDDAKKILEDIRKLTD